MRSLLNRLIRSHAADTRGTAAIEFAILAVPMLALALGVAEMGRYCWTLEALQASVVQGSRCIGVHQTGCYSSGTYSSSGTVSYVQGVAQGWSVAVPSADISATQSTSCGNVAGFAQIQITYTFSSAAGKLIPALNSVPMTVSSCFPDNP